MGQRWSTIMLSKLNVFLLPDHQEACESRWDGSGLKGICYKTWLHEFKPLGSITFDYCKLSFDLSLADISVTTAPGTEDQQDSWSWREDLHPQECHDNRIQLLPEASTMSLTCHNCMSHPEQPSGLCPHSLGWKQVSQQNWKNPHNVRLERILLLDRRD